MAFNFDAGQFNKEKTSIKMGNWQVPRWSPTRARPLEYRPDPIPVCDNNGHFLPGARRGTSKCFGHYVGTWDLPTKITKKVAEQLAQEPPKGRFEDWLHPRKQRTMTPARMRAIKAANREDKMPGANFRDNKVSNVNKKIDQADDEDQNIENEKEIKVESPSPENLKQQNDEDDGNGSYIPGSLTDSDKRHESHDLLVEKTLEDIHGPQPSKSDKFWANIHKKTCSIPDIEITNKMQKPLLSPSYNFEFAKKMHVGNLEHQPLPDTLCYRKLKEIGEHRDSDIVVKPYAIAWKGYGASGPTCCTKMRIHRPKTSDHKAEASKSDTLRPSTSMPEIGSKYKKHMSLMDLAICWDFKPDSPRNEPKPPKHIDGSNGSKAPAVFTMVQTPKQDHNEDAWVTHTNPIFNKNPDPNAVGVQHMLPYFDKDLTKEKRKDSCDVQYCPQHNNTQENSRQNDLDGPNIHGESRKNSCNSNNRCGTPSRSSCHDKNISKIEKLPINKQNEKINGNKYKNRNSIDSYSKTSLAQGKLQHSSEREHSKESLKDGSQLNSNGKYRHCHVTNEVILPTEHRKEDYKFAFKAGNPNSVQSSSDNSSKEHVRMPKMRQPYSKKSYTIPTLAPPFCIWKDANTSGYPEHWRLASVYQHAYKPLDQRRKPLLSSVYQ